MILSTLSISPHDFTLGFFKRSHPNREYLLIINSWSFPKLADVGLSLSNKGYFIYLLFFFFCTLHLCSHAITNAHVTLPLIATTSHVHVCRTAPPYKCTPSCHSLAIGCVKWLCTALIRKPKFNGDKRTKI